MRYHSTLLVLVALLLQQLAWGAEDTHAITVNAHVSNRQIALNTPVRVDFVTMPRQIANVDIALVVNNAIALNGQQTWRLLGHPMVSEHEKTHTVTVSFTLLPRISGSILLPQIPLTWLQGDQLADFGQVKVAEKILIGGDLDELPKECSGAAGYPWGVRISEVKTTRIADNLFETKGDVTTAKPKADLELIFRSGELAAAEIIAPGLSIDQARQSFFSRWGMPQVEEQGAITWIIGWTRITASEATGDQGGVHLSLVREDIQSRLDQARVKGAVFDVLDQPAAPAAPESEDAKRDRQRREAEEFLHTRASDSTGHPTPGVTAPADAPFDPKVPRTPASDQPAPLPTVPPTPLVPAKPQPPSDAAPALPPTPEH